MKTIVRSDNNVSLYVFGNDEFVGVEADRIVVGSPEKFVVSDCNSGNVTVYENVTPPADWTGWKYFFDGTTWTQNPDWVDPSELGIG